jgi:3-hydroxybutyrate dehydrogenase
MKLHGKILIATSAASGIGKAIARAFAREGANVAIADLNLGAARPTSEKADDDNG